MGRIVFVAVLSFVTNFCPNSTVSAQSYLDKKTRLTNLVRSVADSLSSYQIVMLGEPTHGEGNILEIKAALLKELVSQHGFTIIAFESGIYDLWKAHQSNTLGVYDVQNIKNGLFSIWSCSEQMVDLFSSLAIWKQNVQVIGYDFQFSGETASETLLDDLEILFKSNGIPMPDSSMVFWSTACTFMSENFDVPKNFDIQRFLTLSDTFVSYLQKEKKTYDNQVWIQIFKSTAALAIDYFENAPSSKDEMTWRAKDSNSRDKQMANNLLFYRRLYPDRKIVCWGASAHFAKGFELAESKELKEFIPMGEIMADSLNGKIFSLAFTGARGTYGISSQEVKNITNLSTMEDSLSRQGIDYTYLPFKNVSKKFSSKALEFKDVVNGWNSTFDGFFFVDEITPNTINCSFQEKALSRISGDRPIVGRKKSSKVMPENESKDRIYFLESIRTTEQYSGLVKDARTKMPIPYATIRYAHSNIGTVSDENGNFFLPKSFISDSVIISCVGYKAKIVTRDLLHESTQNQIGLEEEIGTLNEVIVRGEKLDARGILKRAVKAIERNFIQSSYETNVRLIQLSTDADSGVTKQTENLIKKRDRNGYIFFSPYPGNDLETTLLKSRVCKIDSISNDTDTLACKPSTRQIRSAIGFIDLLNFRKNTFLNPSKWKSFDFELLDVLEDQDFETYRIGFRCRRPSHFNTLQLAPVEYWGEVFISSADYAIIKILTNTLQDKANIWHAEKYPAFKKDFVWFNTAVVEYKRINGFYFLSSFIYTSNWDNSTGFVEMRLQDVSY